MGCISICDITLDGSHLLHAEFYGNFIVKRDWEQQAKNGASKCVFKEIAEGLGWASLIISFQFIYKSISRVYQKINPFDINWRTIIGIFFTT